MRKIELEIQGLSNTITQSQSYAVILAEKQGLRKLPIVIGAFEAQAIAVAIEKLTVNRPLSHDLIKNIFQTYQINLVEVLIDNLQDGIFYAKLICERDGVKMDIDSRTSDALALAVRFDCPVFTYDFILDNAGTIIADTDKEEEEDEDDAAKVESASFQPPSTTDDISQLNLTDLKSALQEALDHEDYEKAAHIRDEIEKRKSS